MVQGTTILTGDIVTVYSRDDEVTKMIAVGKLATYTETTDEGDIVYAESEEMIHNSLEKKVELFRRGKVTKNGNIIRSDYILYLTEEGLMDTGTKQDRINIVHTAKIRRRKKHRTPPPCRRITACGPKRSPKAIKNARSYTTLMLTWHSGEIVGLLGPNGAGKNHHVLYDCWPDPF